LISCIVPARNEAGRLQEVVDEILTVSEIDQIIIIEGGSTDNTFLKALSLQESHPDTIISKKQNGKGKFDAVLHGIQFCKNDLVIIWDADGTVPLESTRKVVHLALKVCGPAIGNRLRGNMERGAMQRANYLANWMFAILWAPILRGAIYDLLCGTKIFPKSTYEQVPEVLRRMDPYGDFALLLTARLQNLSISSIPVDYVRRRYGSTNIRRWSGGATLLKVSIYAYLLLISGRKDD
jgi:glycosyltransferase involved in cell wall biosynthesis